MQYGSPLPFDRLGLGTLRDINDVTQGSKMRAARTTLASVKRLVKANADTYLSRLAVPAERLQRNLRGVCVTNIIRCRVCSGSSRRWEPQVPDSEDAESLQFYKLVGAKVRSARIEAGLSQAILAEQVGLTRSSVANLEAARQRTSLYHFVLISRALGAEVSELLPDEPSPYDSQFTSSLQNELADLPGTAQEFVRGAVARLQSSSAKTEISQ